MAHGHMHTPCILTIPSPSAPRPTHVDTTKGLAKAKARVKRTIVICTAAKDALKPQWGRALAALVPQVHGVPGELYTEPSCTFFASFDGAKQRPVSPMARLEMLQLEISFSGF